MCFRLGQKIGLRLRQQAIGAIHAKVLRLNSSSITKVSTGQVVNLVSNDVRRFDDAAVFWPYLLVAPLELVLILLMITCEVGFVPSVAGIGFFVLQIPLQVGVPPNSASLFLLG